MNWRLLTEGEKLANRHARQRRKDQQKAARRIELALAAIHDPALLACDSALPGQQGCDLLWPRDLRRAKQSIRRMNTMAAAACFNPAALPENRAAADDTVLQVARPQRVLQKANRAPVPRYTIVPMAPLDEFLGVERALEHARQLFRGWCVHVRLLQFLADPMATGFSFSACAELAFRTGIIAMPVSAEAVEALEWSAKFTARLDDGRRLHGAMVASRQLEPAAGDWAFFERAALSELLPGLTLPHVLRRDEFLIRVIVDRSGLPVCLDLHAVTFKPLCRHPLDSRSVPP